MDEYRMPVLELPALFVSPDARLPGRPDRRFRARVRFGSVKARRLKHYRRPRRIRLHVQVLSMSGADNAILSSITLYGGTLAMPRRLKRREIVAMRLPSGGRIQARVRWGVGNRIGIRLMTPVADFARLLRESRKAQGAFDPKRPRSTAPLASKQSRPVGRLHRALTDVRRLGRQILRWCRSL
jgi:hypothetical protein